GGKETVLSGGTTVSAAVNGFHIGGTANVTAIGELEVDSGASASAAIIGLYGSGTVFSGGTADSSTINGGSLTVSGGTVTSTTVKGGGLLTVTSGGLAISTTISGSGGPSPIIEASELAVASG